MMTRILLRTSLFLIASLVYGSVNACTTSAWLGGTSGSAVPDNPNNSVPRVKGLCGLQLTATGYVQDNTPAAETSFVARFYFLPRFSGTGSTDIFVAYSDEATTSAIVIRYANGNLVIDATAIGGGTATVAANSDGWNLVEFSWSSGGSGDFWVNADATSAPPSASFSPGSGSIEAVRLGSPNGMGGYSGSAVFDDYVSMRTQAIGPLLPGDANDDTTVDVVDIGSVTTEFLTTQLASGTPDCNLDGIVNSSDIDCVVASF